jgi:hypothetical protein
VNAERLHDSCDHARVVKPGGRLLIGVTHAEAAAEIEIFQSDAKCAKLTDKTSQATQRLLKWRQSGNLRANVGTNAVPLNPCRTAVVGVKFARSVPIQSEFMIAVSGGNVRVSSGLNVRIDSDGDAGSLAATLHLFRRLVE